MKKILVLTLVLSLILPGCGIQKKTPYTYTDYTLFDTVTVIMGYGDSAEKFEAQAKEICRELQTYHRLFHIYEEYDGIHNLKTVNDRAGISPVQVEKPVISLLQDCEKYWEITDHTVNVGMGSLLSLWHTARQQASADPARAEIPDEHVRLQAQQHMDLHNMVLDLQAETVFLKDPDMRLDVGAAAKGWAVQQAGKHAPEGILMSVGGNVLATGPKPDGSPWIVGIQNPDGEGYLRTVELSHGSLVTSGDYQRCFEVDGKRYHHIIDPLTTMPGTAWRSVTVFSEDSALADALSTALFLLPRERGQEILKKTGAEALWVDGEGQIFCSPGFPK